MSTEPGALHPTCATTRSTEPSAAQNECAEDLDAEHYRPKTNGKAERFIQTLLREWAYAAAYPTSRSRTAALPAFLDRYNLKRPHKALDGLTPADRLAERINDPAADS